MTDCRVASLLAMTYIEEPEPSSVRPLLGTVERVCQFSNYYDYVGIGTLPFFLRISWVVFFLGASALFFLLPPGDLCSIDVPF